MSRYRMYPSVEQAEGLLRHCGQARFVWNLAVEQAGYRHHGQRVYRVRRDAAGRWHIAFAHVPAAVAGRQSQAAFRCTACGFACHADVNAALNIAAGRAVTAWGASPWGGAVNREPQHVTSSVG